MNLPYLSFYVSGICIGIMVGWSLRGWTEARKRARNIEEQLKVRE